jgi:2-succinyl-6-hydroxy-2,4-cyclohexadiene-1-carboxylate synthase
MELFTYNSLSGANALKSQHLTLVALHGFSGSGHIHFELLHRGLAETRQNTSMRIVAPDLPGHGKTPLSDSDDAYTLSGQLCALHTLISRLAETSADNRVGLLGYSMGSRLALAFALQYPEMLHALVLESCNTGIADPVERQARVLRDEHLAESILRDYPAFLRAWNRLPLFASPEDAPLELARKFEHTQLLQRPEGLAASLRMFSTGRVPDLSDQLPNLQVPTLVITGALDLIYTQRWQQLASESKSVHHEIVAGAGHRVHLDRPDAYIALIRTFLDQIV